MRFLFIHQNFPGQFKYLASHLADDPQHEVIAIGEAHNLKARGYQHARVRLLGYTVKAEPIQAHPYLQDLEVQTRRGQAVAALLKTLKQQGYLPEVVYAHPAWGESLFVKDVFPNCKLVQFLEYYYQSRGGDVDFDPEFPFSEEGAFKLRLRNTTQLQSLVCSDLGISPTHWQQSRYPKVFQPQIQVVHDGIATDNLVPNPHAWVTVNGQKLHAGEEIITFVARNLEPYRGFHTFMRALAQLLRLRPRAKVIVVGGDEVSYGQRLPPGQSYRQHYMAEVGDQVDWTRVYFVGQLPYHLYLNVLQVSAVHLYLTYPFVLSWSMLEAMSVGCLLVASSTAPVIEVIREGDNGFLTDFFDASALAEKVAQVVAQRHDYAHIRQAARSHVQQHYDLYRVCLPRQVALLHAL